MRPLLITTFIATALTVFGVLHIASCKKDTTATQTFDYYDFPDVVVKYPSDTTVMDSVSFGLTSGSANDMTAFAYFNNYFGTADSIHTNKYISISSNSSYELINQIGWYCCQTASLHNSISADDFNTSTLNHYSWTHHETIYSDIHFTSMDYNCGNVLNEFYIPLRNSKINNHYAGWLHCSLSTDSIVFYDCAFSNQPNLTINAGEH